MKLVRFETAEGVRPGALDDDAVVDLSSITPSMETLIDGGAAAVSAARDLISSGQRVPLGEVRLRAPLQPASLRDFLAFEDHAKAGAARRGEELNASWYEMPVYYKGNHREILGPDEELPWPSWTQKLDFELEIACIVGARARECTVEEAAENIFGYTIMNDWSARDVQRVEMAMRLGPAKSKDFATSLGPCIVTRDEFDPGDGVRMRAVVDGVVWFETEAARMHWSFAEMIAYVASSETVYPCDVYGSGTAYGGCGLDQDRWLARGSVLELMVDGIGTLRTSVV
ncbi:MAG TPA: fumarylacetoacetate hydrolase family protein [Actinomycetota bacterium]|nr:fumarylacetoacetate hydrolase family protein [Actinomycetota bacterium]